MLWECSFHAEAAEKVAYQKAITSLHAFLTDILPATLPCVRAKAEHGVIELFADQDARTQEIDLYLEEGEKVGVVLDRIDVTEWSGGPASPIAIALIRPNSAAAKDNRLARGDQILYVNGHSLSQVSLQRAR